VTNASRTDYGSELSIEDSVFKNATSEGWQIQEFEETGFTWKETKGDEYPVYIAHTGSCFIIKTSKSGEEYRMFLCEEVSEQIRNGLNKRKINKFVEQDTIFSFLGKPIVINNKIYHQISTIAAQDKMLSYSNSIIQICDVRWRIHLMQNSIALMTSVQPDDSKMKQVVKYLNSIYGKPYQDEDGYSIKWSSSDDSLDIFKSGSTLVHLCRVSSGEGGTFLFFK
jgi:hypothetical protein